MRALAREGLDARRLSLLARRLRRAEAAIETAVDGAMAALSPAPWSERGPIVLDAGEFNRLPAEVALRLLGRAIARAGDEGPVQLGKLESLYEALTSANAGDACALAPHPGGRAGHPAAVPARDRACPGRARVGAAPRCLEAGKALANSATARARRMVKGIDRVPLAGAPPAPTL